MTRFQIALAVALGSLVHVEAAPESLDLEFAVTEATWRAAVEQAEAQRDSGFTEGPSHLLRLEALTWEPSTGVLERFCTLRVLFVREHPLQLTADELASGAKALELEHYTEASSMGTLTRPTHCNCSSSHVDDGLGAPAGTRGAPPKVRVSFDLFPIRILERTATAGPKTDGTVYEVTWRGRVGIMADVEQRVQLLSRHSGHVRIEPLEPQLDEAFLGALAKMVASSLHLLEDGDRLKEAIAAKARRRMSKAGLSKLLSPPAVVAQDQKNLFHLTTNRIRFGDLVGARVYLARLRAGGAPGSVARSLQRHIGAKQRRLDAILAVIHETWAAGDQTLARRLIESYLLSARTWSLSSVLRVEYARMLLAEGRKAEALRNLRRARGSDLELPRHADYVELVRQASN